MNRFFKISLVSLFNSLIIMTLILAPINYRGGSNSAHAEDKSSSSVATKEECIKQEKKDRESGKPGIYKAGCQFNEDLGKSKLKDHYGEGGMAIVEQFIGAVFALIGITAIHKPIPSKVADCPQHIGAKATFPIVAAGSLAYLIGEISANSEFKKASKKAVDHAFAAKKSEEINRNGSKEQRDESRKTALKNQEENTKQLKAYEALESVYKSQVSGMNKKIRLATAAEIAFIAAEVMELQGIASEAATGVSMWTEAQAEYKTIVASMKPNFTSVMAGGAACKGFGANVGLYLEGIYAYELERIAKAKTDVVKKAVSSKFDSAASAAMLAPSFAIAPKKAVPKAKVELVEQTSNAALNDGLRLKEEAMRKALLGPLASTYAACGTAAANPYNTLDQTALPFATALTGQIASLEALRIKPVLCTSSDVSVIPTENAILVTGPDIINSTMDTISDGAAYSLTTKSPNEYIKTESNRFYVRTIINNLFHRLAHKKIQDNKNISVFTELNQISESSKYVNFLTDEAMKKFENFDFNKELEESNKQEKNIEIYLAKTLKDLKRELNGSAHAVDFKELLNLGVKVGILYWMMGDHVRNYAFPKAKNRAITWGVMAIVNAAILNFDKKKKDEASDRLKVVQKEKEAFMKSQVSSGFVIESNTAKGLNGGSISMEDATGGSGNGRGIMGCAVPKGSSFAPAPCPTVIPKKRFAINTGEAKFVVNGSPLKNALNALPQVAYGAATGTQYSNPSLMSANVKNLESQRKPLLRTAASLRKKFDKLPKAKDKNGKTIKRASLAGINSKFKKMYSGNSNKTAITPSMAASINSANLKGLKDLEGRLDGLGGKKKGSSTASNAVPSFKFPKSSGSSAFDFDLDSDDGGVEISDSENSLPVKGEEDLGEFIVEAGEINENENVNIFKVISNRYLQSYPVLLEEKK